MGRQNVSRSNLHLFEKVQRFVHGDVSCVKISICVVVLGHEKQLSFVFSATPCVVLYATELLVHNVVNGAWSFTPPCNHVWENFQEFCFEPRLNMVA